MSPFTLDNLNEEGTSSAVGPKEEDNRDGPFPSSTPNKALVDIWTNAKDPQQSGFNLHGTVEIYNNSNVEQKRLSKFMDLASTKKLAEKMGSKFGDAYGPLLPNFKFRAFITRSSKVTGELLLWLYGSVETVESLVRSVGEQALLVQALQIQVDQLQNVKRNNKELMTHIHSLSMDLRDRSMLANRESYHDVFTPPTALFPNHQPVPVLKRQRVDPVLYSGWDRISTDPLPKLKPVKSVGGPSLLMPPAAEQLDGLSEMELSINEAVKTKNQTKARGELERFKTKVQSEVESLQAKAQNLEDLVNGADY
ncbi:hypothetical protein HDU79_009929 [Rhizoclosmatium sp. JEL0117]|nr:hypothetical protein HDU79_009929 [Rhizoclosmatium sp. JEL0117]